MQNDLYLLGVNSEMGQSEDWGVLSKTKYESLCMESLMVSSGLSCGANLVRKPVMSFPIVLIAGALT